MLGMETLRTKVQNLRLFRASAESDEAERRPLTKPMIASLARHFPYLDVEKLSSYRYERRSTPQHSPDAELIVYDETGHIRFEGRWVDRATVAFWQPSRGGIDSR